MKTISILRVTAGIFIYAAIGFGQEAKLGKIADIKQEDKKVAALVERKPEAAQAFAAVTKDDPVNKDDLIRLGDKTWTALTFDDGGYVKMRRNARVQILDVDRIYLMEGDLFVNNKWHTQAGRKFKVQTKRITGGTTGTQFIMSYSEEKGTTELFVFKGEVTLESEDPEVLRPDGVSLRDSSLVVKQGDGVILTANSLETASPEIFEQVRLDFKSWSPSLSPKEGLTPLDMQDSRLINLGGSVGSNFVPGQDSRKPAEDAVNAGSTPGDLAPPPPPPN